MPSSGHASFRGASAVNIEAIDLFCGAGGLSYGLQEAGISVKAGLDLDGKCSYPFEANMAGAKFLERDLAQTSGEELSTFYSVDSVKLLAGCAPCQPFSTLRNGSDRQTNKKWPLLNEFGRIIEALAPDVVTMENVPVLRGETVFRDFLDLLESNGYHVFWQVVDAADYGVPQRRKRLVLLASQMGPIHLLEPSQLGTERVTVRQAIGDLPAISAGQVSPNDLLHRARAITDLNLERIKASRPGGTWEDWPERLRLECHRKSSGSSYKSVYGRLEWDKPSGTITTQAHNFGTGRFGHPEQHRPLSLRELAILQSFPENYRFVDESEEVEFTPLGRLIGNAVPVKLGNAIGRSIVAHLERATGIGSGVN
ncbi:DNA cytosine methyltransferase [Rhizobium leguminosarum bv. viciae]|nr:DNA cytosine methyltransferase [Rhizobium leguminosarum bv. viciae]TCA55159.1 DNA cytosine methyltransferase [Rhizobium leguminosarum bv. viciae]TCB15933.1 DNA cytosine methyltransferase [Rhizobium leguminosarum bv. viciae]